MEWLLVVELLYPLHLCLSNNYKGQTSTLNSKFTYHINLAYTMHPILLYLLKMLLCSGLLYAYYRTALYNERFHQWNRFYLLGAMLLSVFVPLIEIPVDTDGHAADLILVMEALPFTAKPRPMPFFTTEKIVLTIGVLVSIMLLLNMLRNLYLSVYKPYKEGEVSSREDIAVIITPEPTAPYSFFNWLFWRADLKPNEEHGRRVLEHELTHIREKHSADKLFTELILIVFWCNPIFWLIKKELYIIHEFLADRKAITDHNGAAFAQMILQTMHVHHTPPLANPFFTSQIKRRLKMITTSNKPQFSYLRRIAALVAMTGVSFVLMLTLEKGMAQKAPPPPPPPPPPPQVSLPDSIKNISVQTTQGKTMVTVTLQNGKVRKLTMDEAIKKGYPVPPPPPPPPPPPAAPPRPNVANLKNEQIKEIIFETKQQRYKVALTNSSSIDLTETEGELLQKKFPDKMVVRLNGLKTADMEPIYIYAGLQITKAQMEQINPDQIESIDVLKGDKAISQYGDKGKNGVIVIKPKNGDYSSNNNVPNFSAKEVVVVGYDAKRKLITDKNLPDLKTIDQNVLIIYNGKKISHDEMNGIDPKSIKTINVLKGKTAAAKYGSEGQNGVIEISTQEEIYEKIFTKAEKMPEFPGGHEGWTKHLVRNLRYPVTAIDKHIEGVAKISFIVDEAGRMSDFSIVDNPGEGLGEEALRVIKQGPDWVPAQQNGHKVKARVYQTITFKID